MKLARFTHNGITRIGKVEGDLIYSLAEVVGHHASMKAVLDGWAGLKPQLERAIGEAFALSDVTLEAPIDDPRKLLAIGMNYEAHMKEAEAMGQTRPAYQFWFNKQVSCINGPYHDVEMPRVSAELDYEVELGVVIGKKGRHVSRDRTRNMIAGYMVCNDYSVRDWQLRSPTFTLGKSFYTHGVIGPWITTDDEIADPHSLDLWLTVNGEERQRSTTADLIHDIYEQIAYLSTVMTLEPGDILETGTPSGVAILTKNWLKVGDIVRAEVEGLGYIQNRIVAEP